MFLLNFLTPLSSLDVAAMGNASSSLYNTLEEIYEEEWDGQSELGNIKEVWRIMAR